MFYTFTWVLSAQTLTCYGLEQVSAVLHVVVSVVVVGSLTERSALLIGSEVLVYGHFEVFRRQAERVSAVVSLPQQELSLRGEGKFCNITGVYHSIS